MYTIDLMAGVSANADNATVGVRAVGRLRGSAGAGARVGAVARRAVGVASRRLGRPELLAAVDAVTRTAEAEAIGIRAVLATALPRDGIYVDVGANRGQILTEALRLAPEGRHIAFEPIPELVAEAASAFPSVDFRQMALGGVSGVAEFCHFTTMDGWSGLRRSPKVSDERGQPRFITVAVSTLDVELASVKPDVVKIDVEGAELDVLEGARGMLERARPVVVFEHVGDAAALYGGSSEAIWDLLGALAYRLFSVTGYGPVTPKEFANSTHTVNWLAVPEPNSR